MALASVTSQAATEADILRNLQKKSFSVRPIAKQNTIVKGIWQYIF